MQFFPTPYAIDLGDRTVKIAQLVPRRRWEIPHAAPRFRVCAERELEEGWIVRGVITNLPALAAFLRRTIARCFPSLFRSEYAVIALPEARTFLTTINAPPATERTPAAIRRAAAAVIPIDIERATLTATPIAGVPERLAIAAAPTDVVESYAALFEKSGLTLIACTTEANALARAVAAASGDKSHIILDLGATRTGAIIAVGTTVAASVTLPVSGLQLTAAVAAKLRVNSAAAEQAKRHVDLARARSDDPAATAVIQALAPIAEGIKHLQSFAARHLPAATHPTRIVLTGGGAALGGMDNYLREQVQLPTERFALPPAVAADFPSAAARSATARLATVFGLGSIALDPAAALAEPIV